jgi:L-aspartate oxidase
VKTDLYGRTSVAGLYAAGEVAATGVHGANRLASNSLLEGLVFGARVGRQLWERADAPLREAGPEPGPAGTAPPISNVDVRELAWRCAGIERDAAGLEKCLRRLEGLDFTPEAGAGRAQHELRNSIAVVGLIARSALARRESRGAHYRSDFPQKQANFRKHSCVSLSHDVTFA